MEQKDWIITPTGRVIRRDKLQPTDIANDTLPYSPEDGMPCEQGVDNSFPTKEDAYLYRDHVIDLNPMAFIEDTLVAKAERLQEQNEEKNARRKPKDYTNEDFNRLTRKKLIENYDVFWENFRRLAPKDVCDVYMKMARYGFSPTPQLRPIDEETEQRRKEEALEQTAETIASGLPPI